MTASAAKPGEITENDKENSRDKWGNPVEFLLSCVAMSVGLGNIWRFPFTAYRNGGGAFLIPYVVVLILLGKPFYYLEMAVGQFTSYGCVGLWNVVPAFRGVGYGQMVGACTVVSYYVSIMAITLFYLAASFSQQLPWTLCDPRLVDMSACIGANTNVTAVTLSQNSTSTPNLISAQQAYFRLNVLRSVETLEEGVGAPEWRLTICLALSWLAIFFSIVRGVKSSGKIAYFTALFPYVVLLSLLIRGLTLPGAINGIIFYLRPDWSKLLSIEVWSAALSQCFFSLSVGFGVVSMFASFNKFNHKVSRDAAIISTMDMLTSFVAGLTIFSILGNLAHEMGVSVDEVARDSSGSQLAFVTYPRALANFPAVPQLFAVMFFLMLFTLGLGSATAFTSCPITVICDHYPGWKRWKVTSVICLAGFLIGLVYITPAGDLVLNLVDYFGADFVIIVLAALEMVGLAWIYNYKRICRDLKFMLGRSPNAYWKLCWVLVMPVMLLTMCVYKLINITPQPNGVKYQTPALVGGWCVALLGLLPVPACFIYEYVNCTAVGFKEKMRSITRPNIKWGPMNEDDRQAWLDETDQPSNSIKV